MADAPKPRWYHLTPDRVVLGLLAIEGFLILSERLEWFGFDCYKGWIALAGMASLGLAMGLMLLWFLAAWIFRRRFQFSIRAVAPADGHRRHRLQLAGRGVETAATGRGNRQRRRAGVL